MNIETLEKMRQMKFYGMHSAFQSALETGKLNDFTTDQLIAHLVSSEHDERHNRKINRHIANAKFRYQSDL